jgi:uncharacterized protein YecE (DUF72 family)
MGDVRIGTSGWNYPSGRGTWNSVFYPPRGRRPKGFDELSYYATHFDTVEVNSTFYGQPRAAITRAWVERTPSDFEFAVKLYQKFTHPRMFASRLTSVLPEDAGADRELVQALSRPNAADLDEFRRGIDPLASGGKLGVLLAQFPASFKNTPEAREYLIWLLGAFSDHRVAVELRHGSWSDRVGDTLALLNEFGSAWVQIDEPKFRFSIRQNYLPNIQGFYYMRLHGRNADAWWRHDRSEDRYDYLYSADELSEFSETLDAARTIVKRAYLYTNNHFSAKSVANAVMIKRHLGQPIEGAFEASFLTRYPGVAPLIGPAGVTASRTSS